MNKKSFPVFKSILLLWIFLTLLSTTSCFSEIQDLEDKITSMKGELNKKELLITANENATQKQKSILNSPPLFNSIIKLETNLPNDFGGPVVFWNNDDIPYVIFPGSSSAKAITNLPIFPVTYYDQPFLSPERGVIMNDVFAVGIRRVSGDGGIYVLSLNSQEVRRIKFPEPIKRVRYPIWLNDGRIAGIFYDGDDDDDIGIIDEAGKYKNILSENQSSDAYLDLRWFAQGPLVGNTNIFAIIIGEKTFKSS